MKFQIGITGNGEVPSVFYSKEGQELINKLCQGPVPKKEISSELLDKFQRINALRENQNHYYLNFTCFLKEDIDYLNLKCDKLSESLAEKIQKDTKKYIPLEVKFDEVGNEKYLYFIVGCVCLDWNGLKTLENLKLTVSYDKQNKNEYGNYSLFVNEDTENSVKELYWGSHNSKYGKFWFTTFGDHTTQRLGFPDLININPSHQLQKKIFFNMIHYYMPKVGKVLTKREKPDDSMKDILIDLKYIKNGELNIPIIVSEDMKTARNFIILVDVIIKDWLIENSNNLKKVFKNLTPVRFGVDFKEVLIQVWHYIFGHANKHLSRNGYFFNPYSSDSDFDGFLPVVYEDKCNLSINDFI